MEITRVSTDAAGEEANGGSGLLVVSADGTKVLFSSTAPNLVPGDTNGQTDVFLKNLTTGAIIRVSTGSAGEEANGSSNSLALSPDGTKVLFSSTATNLVASDTNGVSDIFMKDLVTGAVTRISVDSIGTQANGASQRAVFSPDGTKIAFGSAASNLVAGDTNGEYDVFIKDLATGAVTRISTDGTGAQVAQGADDVGLAFSPDGGRIVFISRGAFVADDTNGFVDVFVKDLATGVVTRVSTDSTGQQGNFPSLNPVFSPDGTKIAFQSTASNLVAGDTNASADIFIKDLASQITTRVSTSALGAQGDGLSSAVDFSPDGARITFSSAATNLVSGDTNGQNDIFVKDLATGAVTLISVGIAGAQANGISLTPKFLPNGNVIAFLSFASNLVADDTNAAGDIFIARLVSTTPSEGDDELSDTPGNDTINALGGNDRVTVTNGRDTVAGGAGTDTLVVDYRTATGAIAAYAGPTANPAGGFDGIYSEGSPQVSQRLVSYTGIERFVFMLGSGNDTLTIASSLDQADGGGGDNRLSGDFSAGPAVSIDLNTSTRFVNFQSFGSITGSAFADIFVTTDAVQADVINAGDGDDVVTVRNGRDTIGGGAGFDTLIVDYSAATGGVGTHYDGSPINPAGGFNGIYSEGSPQVSQRLVSYTGFERFVVTTGSGADTIITKSGDDEVRTGAGDDRVDVGSGFDIADGGEGIDAISADLSALLAGVTIDLGNAVNSGAYGTYSNFEYFGLLIGSAFADIFVTTDVVRTDVINAGDGDDVVTVRNGSDTVDGGAGFDTLIIDYRAATGAIAAYAGPTANPAGGFDGIYSEGSPQVSQRFVTYTGIERFVFMLGSGNDTLTVASSLDEADGGGGNNRLSGNFSAGPAVSIDLNTSTRFVNFQSFESVTGSAFADTFVTTDAVQADVINAGDGDDAVTVRNGRDTVDGGAGNDTLIIDYRTATGGIGTYDGPTVNPAGGFNGIYSEGAPQFAQRLVSFTGVERFVITTGSGNDTITTGAGDDFIDLSAGGADTVAGGAGNDGFYFGAALDAGDSVDGGAGTNDQLAIRGTYQNFTLAAAHLVGVETLALLSGTDTRFGPAGGPFHYDITSVDANVAAGQRLIVNANSLTASETFHFDGSAETDGSFIFYGGFAEARLIGGAGSDGFYFGEGRFNPSQQVDGLAGADDQLGLRGNYTLTFLATTMRNIDTIAVLTSQGVTGATAPYHYDLTLHDGNLAAGATLIVTGVGLGAGETLRLDGAAETDGRFDLRGGAGDDQLIGGARDDVLWGGVGADQLTGNGGADRFCYRNLSESTAGARDTILDFATGDLIDLSVIDAIAGGADDAFTFSATATTAAGSLWVQDNGGGAYTIFAHADADGIADLVIDVAASAGRIWSAADFIL